MITQKGNDVAISEFLSGYSKLNKTFESYGKTFEKITVPIQKTSKLFELSKMGNLAKGFERLSSFNKLIDKNRIMFNPISNSDSSKFWTNYSKSLKHTIQDPEITKNIDKETAKKLSKN